MGQWCFCRFSWGELRTSSYDFLAFHRLQDLLKIWQSNIHTREKIPKHECSFAEGRYLKGIGFLFCISMSIFDASNSMCTFYPWIENAERV